MRTATKTLIGRPAWPWLAGTLLLGVTVVAMYFVATPGTTAAPTSDSTTAASAGTRSGSGAGTTSTTSASLAIAPVSASDISHGPEQAPVVIVEYSDFQCPYCALFAPILKDLRAKYPKDVRLVYRYFPLDYHKHAMQAAEASYAASLQGKFWEMHDLLYANQKKWAEADDATPYFTAMAERIGLDMTRFRKDAAAESTKAFILKEKDEAKNAPIRHTPTFVVDGKEVTPRSLADFESIIKAAR